MKAYDAVVIGDANIDLVVAGCNELPAPGQEVHVHDMTIHVGGGAALFTLALAKLGLKLAFNGVLGGDGFGQFIRDQFSRYGIDTSYIRESSRNTGISIAINPEKDRSFITYTGSNAELSLQELSMESVKRGRHVHLTGYQGSRNHASFMKAIQSVKALGVTTSIDVGWDETGEWYKGIYELMREVDVFFMNEVEAQQYTGLSPMKDCIRELARHSKHIVLKLGAAGAAASVGGRTVFRSGFRVPVVDTTGAGDSFNAGYMYGFLNGQPAEQCLLYGNACGALSVSRSGGSTGAPDRVALERFIAEKANLTTDRWEAAQ
ncbi:carbohydrate kinase family protein [Paenibacillus silvisoli]|uniref:carbohydrate kinase family protein n=1 Tax=Paenibacillus silvisoli TaxID=3110539 RepID=UPI0028063DFC|nr:carbohydrate kinase family protein [Paenibacillus silvisoli]